MSSSPASGTVLAVAPTGEHDGADVPQLPVTADEVANAAAECERIGAALLDLVPRHGTRLAEIVPAVRRASNLLVRITAHARSEALGDLLDAGADVLSCPLDASEAFAADLRSQAGERGTAVHYEARSLDQLGALPAAAHVVLVFDERGMPGDVRTFAAALDRLPTGATFSATGLGSASVPILLTALASGGHLRVGLADTVHYSGDSAVRDNAQLVARAAGLAKIAQRPPLGPADTAQALGITS